MRNSIRIAAITAIVLLGTGCELINLNPISYKTYPSTRNQSIPSNAVVWVEFQDAVDRVEAEKNVAVKNHDGVYECDYSWQGSRLILKPLDPWLPGFRYTLTIVGEFNIDDGRVFSVNNTIPFHTGNSTSLPTLSTHSPADEAMVSITEPLVLTFSAPMDTATFEADSSISPSTELNFVWNATKEVVTVTPQESWSSLTRYTFTVPESVTDANSIPLVEEYQFNFRTLADTTPPALVSAVPWSISGNAPLLVETLDDINNSKGIYLKFDDAIDWEVWESSWSIEPAMKFQSLVLDSSAIALLPMDPWIPKENYTLTLSTKLSDEVGNTVVDPIVKTFTCAIPIQKVLTITHSDKVPDTDISGGSPKGVFDLNVSTGKIKDHSFTFVLAEPITIDQLQGYVDSISLAVVFPTTAGVPSLTSVSLVSSTQILLIYSGFTEPNTGSHIDYFYRLSQKADREGTMNDKGSYLVEDWEILYAIRS